MFKTQTVKDSKKKAGFPFYELVCKSTSEYYKTLAWESLGLKESCVIFWSLSLCGQVGRREVYEEK